MEQLTPEAKLIVNSGDPSVEPLDRSQPNSMLKRFLDCGPYIGTVSITTSLGLLITAAVTSPTPPALVGYAFGIGPTCIGGFLCFCGSRFNEACMNRDAIYARFMTNAMP